MQFETILQGLRDKAINFTTIDTNKLNYGSKQSTFVSILLFYYKRVKKGDIVVYFSSNNYKFFLPFFLLKRIIQPHFLYLRKIGGDLEFNYKSSRLQRFYIKNLLKHVDITFTEADYLKRFLQDQGLRVKQFLNARKPPSEQCYLEPKQVLDLVYIGRLAWDKGVQNLVAIDNKLTDTTITIYGPVESVSSKLFIATKNIRYCGCFNNSEIYKVLSKYHAVILPSQFKGEGHPGSIIEALMAGKPVITTTINYNTEVVRDGYNGILLEGGSASDIIDGINRFKRFDYMTLSKNAEQSVKDYEVNKNIEILLKEINFVKSNSHPDKTQFH